MDITSFQFLAFTLGAALLYNLGRAVFWRQAVFLAANVAFLAAIGSNVKNYVPLAVFVGVGYAGVWLMQNQRWRWLFPPLTGIVIFLFVWLKRYTFFPNSVLLPFPYITIGISYIFFRVLHMIVDARDDALPSVGIVPYLNYTLNFTSIVAGPIQMYPQFASSQLSVARQPLTLAQCALALERAAIGFFKLRVLSSILLAVQQAAVVRLSDGQALREKLVFACVIVAFYPIYLYLNFSGYVDLMIGAARFFRLDLPENFDRPFSSVSFIEFWSRWHMTLSNWWKTYVYTPLVKGLMEKFPEPKLDPFLGVVGFFVTFFLVGVWHGQTSEFLWFGLLQGAGVSLNKLYQITLAKALGRKRFKALDANTVYRAFSRGLTFTYFTFSLIWFWSSWPQMRHLSSAVTAAQQIMIWIIVWFGSTVTLEAWEVLRRFAFGFEWDGNNVLLAAPVRVAWAVYLTLVTLITLSIVAVSTPVLYEFF